MHRRPAIAVLLVTLLLALLPAARTAADEGWTIDNFDAAYQINADGTVSVVEDISVNFGSQQKHGIFRDIPVEYKVDDRHNRIVSITVQSVDNGQTPHKYTTERMGGNLRIKIGDPDRTISGAQRYRIRYTVRGGLNPQAEWDEFYWNVTGNAWPVQILKARAIVNAPSIENVICFEGPVSSTRSCASQSIERSARFDATTRLPENNGLTIAVAMPKGAVAVPPLRIEEIKTPEQEFKDALGLSALPIALGLGAGIVAFLGVLRYWWLQGRDLWLGDVHYLNTDATTRERRRPLFAKDTVVVEYTPPEIGREKRRLRPAEIGTLIDEKADTLDVSATIVDLAVRGYLRITEIPKEGLFGSADYELEKLKPADGDMAAYESLLHQSLFDDLDKVKMSALRNKFYTDLAAVKNALYDQVVKDDKFFGRNPESVRTTNLIIGFLVIALGVVLAIGLGTLGYGIVGIPVAIAGVLLLVLSRSMPRRTGPGREMYRRALGFREYMTVAETDRQRFNEEIGLFQQYLPYAMVFGCVDKWAKAFEGLDLQQSTGGWYVGAHPFTPVSFSSNLQGFATSMSSAIASTPGGSGSSGFSGGGSSGGGGGGGGGGSW